MVSMRAMTRDDALGSRLCRDLDLILYTMGTQEIKEVGELWNNTRETVPVTRA